MCLALSVSTHNSNKSYICEFIKDSPPVISNLSILGNQDLIVEIFTSVNISSLLLKNS